LIQPDLVGIGKGVALADYLTQALQECLAIEFLHLCLAYPGSGPSPEGRVLPRLTDAWNNPRDQVRLDHRHDANGCGEDQAVTDRSTENLSLGAHPVDTGGPD